MRVYRNKKHRRLGIAFAQPRDGDAGYDLHAIESRQVAPGQRILVETGLHLEIPGGYVGVVKDRSSVAIAGLHTIAGVIDSAYRGEVKILLVNSTDAPIDIRAGQKIAQMLILPVSSPPIEFVESLEDLSSTARGVGGFGSTGE